MAVGASFKQGDYLEYTAEATEVSTFQGSANSSAADAAQFRLTLGAPVQIAGVAMFPVSVSGGTHLLGTIDLAPRWHYLGAAGGKLYGSVDGRTVQTVYSPDGALSGFFATRDPAQPATLAVKPFQGDYMSASGIAADSGSSSGGCQMVGDVQVCSDGTSESGVSEFYLDGIGPLGYARVGTSSSNAGGFFSTATVKYTLELTATSLALPAGLTLGRAPTEAAAMAHPRRNALATTHGNSIAVFGRSASGGGTAAEPSEIEFYDPHTAAWSVAGQSPAAMADYAVATIGDSSYFAGSGPFYAYDYSSASWSSPADSPVHSLAGGKSLCGTDADRVIPRSVGLSTWTAADGVERLVMVETEQLPILSFPAGGFGFSCDTETDIFVDVYTPATRSWAPLGTFPVDAAFGVDGLQVAGDRLVLTSGSNAAPIGIDLVLGTAGSDSLSAAPDGRLASAASVDVAGIGQLIGGDISDGAGNVRIDNRQVQAFDAQADTWSAGARLLLGREHAAAVVLGGRVYVLGGAHGGATTGRVESFAP